MLWKTKKPPNPSISYIFSDICYKAQGSDAVFKEKSIMNTL